MTFRLARSSSLDTENDKRRKLLLLIRLREQENVILQSRTYPTTPLSRVSVVCPGSKLRKEDAETE